MAEDAKEWFVRAEDGNVYGPATLATLASWARDGRVEPTGFVSRDRITWVPAQTLGELEMKWIVETEPGKVFGPFNRAVVSRLYQSGNVPETCKVYRLHEYPIDEDEPPKIVEKIVEKVVEKIVEVPVEKIVEKIVEVEKPPRTAMVVPQVVEPKADVPPVRSPGSIFDGVSRDRLMALEQAAQREIAKGRRMRLGGFFGGGS